MWLTVISLHWQVLWHCWLDMGCWYHVYKTKDDQTTGFSRSALTLYVEWHKGHPTHKNPVVDPVSLSFVRAPAYPGVRGKSAINGMFVSWCNYYPSTRLKAGMCSRELGASLYQEDHKRHGMPPSGKIYKQWDPCGEEKRELPVTAAGGRNSLPNVPGGTGETKSSSFPTVAFCTLKVYSRFFTGQIEGTGD